MRRGVRIGLAGATATAVLGAGAAIAVPGFAANTGRTAATAATAATATTADPGTPGAPGRRDRSAERAQYEQALARKLGVDVARLRAAQTAARQAVFLARLDDMVAAGRLTRAQADELREAARAGNLEEALRAQRRARLKAALDGQVAAGLLTRAQADAMLERFDTGAGAGIPGLGGPGRGGHRGPGGFRGMPIP
ncbi:MAG TPA: hypothetical protein VNT51_00570 [Miltoncostaeaceae bacterium]|nr:hypothetical protein [Miltoncostaeaceae bacterium]